MTEENLLSLPNNQIELFVLQLHWSTFNEKIQRVSPISNGCVTVFCILLFHLYANVWDKQQNWTEALHDTSDVDWPVFLHLLTAGIKEFISINFNTQIESLVRLINAGHDFTEYHLISQVWCFSTSCFWQWIYRCSQRRTALHPRLSCTRSIKTHLGILSSMQESVPIWMFLVTSTLRDSTTTCWKVTWHYNFCVLSIIYSE